MSRARNLADLPGLTTHLEDHYWATDGGKMQNAFARAAATGAKRIIVGSDDYQVDDTIKIDTRSHLTIAGPGDAGGSINLQGSAALMFDLGSAAAQRFHLYLEGLVLTRSVMAAGSLVMRVRNCTYFGVEKSRLYMDNKFGSAFDITSGSYQTWRGVRFENSIDHVGKIRGVNPTPGGTVNGILVGMEWNHCIFAGANAGKSDPLHQASVILEDLVQAAWFFDCEGFSHLGPLFDLRGTFANRGHNVLNLFRNPNVEATYENSGTIRVNNFGSTGIESGWGSSKGSDVETDPVLGGNGMPAISLMAGSYDNRVTNIQLGVANSDGITDAGGGNRCEGVELVGYGDAEAGIRYLAGCSKAIWKGGQVAQFKNIAVNEAGDEAGIRVSFPDSSAISAAPFVGFNAGRNSVTGPMSSDTTPFATRPAGAGSTTVELPFGVPGKVVKVTGATGNIQNFVGGRFYGETIQFLLSVGQTLSDIDIAGGNIALATSGSTITGNGRRILTATWDDPVWRLF